MRNPRPIDALMPQDSPDDFSRPHSCTPSRWWYQSDLAHHLGVRPSSLPARNSMPSWTPAFCAGRREGNPRLFSSRIRSVLFLGELTGLMTKTAGLLDVLARATVSLRQKRSTGLSSTGSVARSEERSSSDVGLDGRWSGGTRRPFPGASAGGAAAGPAGERDGVHARGRLPKRLASGHHFLQAVFGP